jgi:formamidopyrimidine-DNA glycosylase
MPELPDVILYVEALDRLLTEQTIRDVRVRSPFVMRTFDPPITNAIIAQLAKRTDASCRTVRLLAC